MTIIKILGIAVIVVILLIVLITSLEVLAKSIKEIFMGKGN